MNISPPNPAIGCPQNRVRIPRLRAPLSRKPLGHRKQRGAIALRGAFYLALAAVMPASATRTPTPISHSLDARQAERIAIDTFLKYTAHKVKTYSVKEVTESATEWKFFIQGTKRFAR